MLATRIRAPNIVIFDMRKLALNRVSIPQIRFIQESSRRCPEQHTNKLGACWCSPMLSYVHTFVEYQILARIVPALIYRQN